jgi:hypothetical protein
MLITRRWNCWCSDREFKSLIRWLCNGFCTDSDFLSRTSSGIILTMIWISCFTMLWRLRHSLLKRRNKNLTFHLPVDTLPGRLLALPQRHLRGLLLAPPRPLGQRPLELSPEVPLPHQPLVLVRVLPWLVLLRNYVIRVEARDILKEIVPTTKW